jgi:hypothetical protein
MEIATAASAIPRTIRILTASLQRPLATFRAECTEPGAAYLSTHFTPEAVLIPLWTPASPLTHGHPSAMSCRPIDQDGLAIGITDL